MDKEKLLSLIPAGVWILAAVLAIWRLSDIEAEIGLLAAIAAWVLWFVVFISLLVPATIGLTAAFISIPIAAAILGLSTGVVDPAILIAGALLPFALVWTPTGDYMVNGSSYGAEKRFLLKPTLIMSILFPIATGIAAAFTGLLFRAITNEQWLIALILILPAAGSIYVAARVIHQGFSRWLVFVPAGIVVHDPYLLKLSAMTRKPNASHLTTTRASIDKNNVVDLTGGASGYSSHLVTKEPIPIDMRNGDTHETSDILFSPLRPGSVLREARVRGFKTRAPNDIQTKLTEE